MEYKSAVIQPMPDDSGKWMLAYTVFTFGEMIGKLENISPEEMKDGVEFDFGIKGKMYLFDSLADLLSFTGKNEKYLQYD